MEQKRENGLRSTCPFWGYLCQVFRSMIFDGYPAHSTKGSFFSQEGARNKLQQDALHLQVVENFLAIFLMVIQITSFQNPSGITLEKVRFI
jgi:hypothetical protein